MQSTALEIGERLAGQQSSNSCSVGPCFFISKAYAKAYGVKAKEAQLVKGVGVSAKKLEDGTYCFVLTLDLILLQNGTAPRPEEHPAPRGFLSLWQKRGKCGTIKTGFCRKKGSF